MNSEQAYEALLASAREELTHAQAEIARLKKGQCDAQAENGHYIAALDTKLTNLRTAAEQLDKALRRLSGKPRYVREAHKELRAALDSTPAEPVREAFDPTAVRELLERIDQYGPIGYGLTDAARRVHDSEKESKK